MTRCGGGGWVIERVAEVKSLRAEVEEGLAHTASIPARVEKGGAEAEGFRAEVKPFRSQVKSVGSQADKGGSGVDNYLLASLEPRFASSELLFASRCGGLTSARPNFSFPHCLIAAL